MERERFDGANVAHLVDKLCVPHQLEAAYLAVRAGLEGVVESSRPLRFHLSVKTTSHSARRG
jgi:hypothetical protein